VPLFTSSGVGVGVGLQNLVLFTSQEFTTLGLQCSAVGEVCVPIRALLVAVEDELVVCSGENG